MTQLQLARKATVSSQMKHVAENERVETDFVIRGLTDGEIIIPANVNHTNLIPCGIGKGLRTKVNANIGTSSDSCDLNTELRKLQTAIDFGADAVMDLSTGGDISSIRRALMRACTVPVGTVPIYQAGIEAIENHGAIVNMTVDEIFTVIEEHARDGVDFMTVHCGVTQASLAKLKKQGRTTDIVSRGGAFLIGWLLHNERENPLYHYYYRLMALGL